MKLMVHQKELFELEKYARESWELANSNGYRKILSLSLLLLGLIKRVREADFRITLLEVDVKILREKLAECSNPTPEPTFFQRMFPRK